MMLSSFCVLALVAAVTAAPNPQSPYHLEQYYDDDQPSYPSDQPSYSYDPSYDSDGEYQPSSDFSSFPDSQGYFHGDSEAEPVRYVRNVPGFLSPVAVENETESSGHNNTASGIRIFRIKSKDSSKTGDGAGTLGPLANRYRPSAYNSDNDGSGESTEDSQDEDTTERLPLAHGNVRRPSVFSSSQVFLQGSDELPTFHLERRTRDFRPIVFPAHNPPSFNPQAFSAAYTAGQVDGDAEEIAVQGGQPPAPDLSRDTAVNYPRDGQQGGLVMIDPDAEVFDLNSIIEAAHDLEFD